jgi:uncharacterized membrane protein
MQLTTELDNRSAQRLAWLVDAVVAGVLLLLAFGWSLEPTVLPLAPSVVLVAYAVLAHISVVTGGHAGARVQLLTLVCGTLSAGVLIWSDVIQYSGRTASNSIVVAVAAGSWLVAGIIVAWWTNRIRDAVLSSILSAEIGSLANVGFILGSYYVLRGSALQAQFFRTEGTYDDFANSGSRDFDSFVIGDLFGGAFFHLVFGVLVAATFGAIVALMTIGVRRAITHQTSLPNGRLHPTASSAQDGRG